MSTPAIYLDGALVQLVASLAKSGSAALHGDVTLSAGVNVTLTQAGQDIAIAASSGSGTPAFVGVRLTNSTNFSHNASGSALAISFDTETFDTSAFHASGAPSRITIPTDGYYLFGGEADWDTNTTGQRAISLRINASASEWASEFEAPTANGLRQTFTTVPLRMVVGDFAELFATQNSGGTRTISATANRSPVFWAMLVGT